MMRYAVIASGGWHFIQRRTPGKSKIFKIVITHRSCLDTIQIDTGRDNIGLYNYKNTIFCAFLEKDLTHLHRTIFHELLHFIMNDIFNNHCECFNKMNSPEKRKITEIVNVTMRRIQTLNLAKRNRLSPNEENLISFYANLFTEYKKSEYTSEILTWIPETLVLLGSQQGSAFFVFYCVLEICLRYRIFNNNGCRSICISCKPTAYSTF